MSSRSYPIWNEVKSCAYNGKKSYGVKQTGEVVVNVGTSASNSHVFVEHCVTHRQLDNGEREYRFYLDGICVKKAVLKDKELIKEAIT